MSQGAIFGLLLLKVFLDDLFYFLEESNSVHYADDTTPYHAGNSRMCE